MEMDLVVVEWMYQSGMVWLMACLVLVLWMVLMALTGQV
jgi:hypothetical protein